MAENKELQTHANKLGEIITQQTNKRLQLENQIEELEKESAENLKVWKAQQQQHTNYLSSYIEVLEEKIKELIKEISVKQNENYELRQRIGHFEEAVDKLKKLKKK